MKIAIIINEALPKGLVTNTAAVLGISLGKVFPEMVREPAHDSEGNEYAGITGLNVPILSAAGEKLREIAVTVQREDEITLIPFTEVAQRSRDYDAYKADLTKTCPEQIAYSGIALAGSDKMVSRFTGSLPLLR
jgi:hypothetical protein